jgi:MATE family, multidrug efflux pump
MRINRQILALAIPNIVSNITIPLLGMVDLAIVGHLDSMAYIGAIAVGSMIFNLIYWSFGFLRMGASGLTAQAYGAKNNPEIMATLVRGMMVAGVAACIVLALQVPIAKFAFFIMDGSDEVESLARSYFYIRIWAAPATIAIYAITGWFIGMQNTKIPMIIAIAINLFNVGFNLFFVYVMDLKSDGVALGTLLAQYCGLFMALILLRKYYGNLFPFIKLKTVFDNMAIKNYFLVNRDIFIRTLCLLAVFTFFTSRSASTNDNILAANSLLLQFMFMFSFLTDGFAYAAEALTGRFYGARQFKLLKSVIRLTFVWGGILGLVFTGLYYMGNELLLGLLTDQAQVVETAKEYTLWIILLPLVSVASFIWDGVFIGLTASKQMRNSMIVAVFAVFFPTWYLMESTYHNHALWCAFILFLFARGLVQTVMFVKMSRRLEE